MRHFGSAARVLPLLVAALALPRAAIGQTPEQVPARQEAPAPAAAAEDAAAHARARAAEAVRRMLEHLGAASGNIDVSSDADISHGDRRIAPGEVISGTVVVAGGTLAIGGTIEDDAIAIDGDVVLLPGGVVRGDAISIGGRVRLEGGTVHGELRRLQPGEVDRGVAPAAPPGGGRTRIANQSRRSARDALSPMAATRRAISLALAGLVMLALLGMGVLVFAGDHLQAVTTALQRQFGRAFVLGIVGQLAVVPVLILIIVALAATIVGVLVIPIAAFGYVLIVGGALALGLLGVARVTGSAMLGPVEPGGGLAAERRAALRSLMVGILIYAGIWVVAAAFTFTPVLGGLLRGLAAVLTWVALTAGLGATLMTRMGTRRRAQPAAPTFDDELAWATPTPVAGIAAARRPGASASRGDYS